MNAPWDDPALIHAALDIACDVRSIDPADAVPVAHVAALPAERLADLIRTMAYLIDIDRPYSEVIAGIGKIDERPFMRPVCTVGHNSAEHGYWNNNHQRCRKCDAEIQSRRTVA